MNIEMIGEDFKPNPNRSAIKRGPLRLPAGFASSEGDLIAIGENDEFLHCVFAKTGSYYGVFKSDDPNHIWQALLELNVADNAEVSGPSTRLPC